MNDSIKNGSYQQIDGVTSFYYDGYWIKRYEPPKDTLTAKKTLIHSLTRRLFNHMEHGINIPGRLLDEVRAAYEAEQDPKKKRVKGAMLAGALFNRAAEHRQFRINFTGMVSHNNQIALFFTLEL